MGAAWRQMFFWGKSKAEVHWKRQTKGLGAAAVLQSPLIPVSNSSSCPKFPPLHPPNRALLHPFVPALGATALRDVPRTA